MFGNSQTVEVPDITCSVFVEVSKILFDDGSIWINSEQKLDNDIVTEDALGEDWLRLRLTKAIRDTKEKTELKKANVCQQKLIIWASPVIVGCCILAFVGMGVQKYFSARQLCYKTAMNYYINRDFQNAAPS